MKLSRAEFDARGRAREGCHAQWICHARAELLKRPSGEVAAGPSHPRFRRPRPHPFDDRNQPARGALWRQPTAHFPPVLGRLCMRESPGRRSGALSLSARRSDFGLLVICSHLLQAKIFRRFSNGKHQVSRHTHSRPSRRTRTAPISATSFLGNSCLRAFIDQKQIPTANISPAMRS